MIKIIDKYVVKQFLQIFFFGILTFVMIFLVIDLMEKLDDFIDKDVPGFQIMMYYIYFVPEMVRLVTPVAVLLGALFTVGKMSTQNELAAIKAAGVSLYRLMIPFVITSFLISVGSMYFGGYVVPYALQEKVHIERKHMKRGIVHVGSNIFFQDNSNRIVTIAYYNTKTLQANRVSIQEFDKDDITKMFSRIDCSRMVYDTLSSNWIAVSGTKRLFTNGFDEIQKFDSLEIDKLNFTPDEVLRKQRTKEEMTLSELSDIADSELKSGNDPTRMLIEYHTRIAFPFASFVIVLFGIPLSANKRKGGLAIQFGINILVTFLYLVLMNIVNAFGKNGALSPILTAWLVNIFFFILAVINILKAQK